MLCGMFDWNESCLVQWFRGLKSLYFNVTYLIECFVFVVVKTNVFCNYIYSDSLQKCMLLHLNEPEWPLSNQFALKLRLRMARLEMDIVVAVKTFDAIDVVHLAITGTNFMSSKKSSISKLIFNLNSIDK